jgi:hypothetical protein
MNLQGPELLMILVVLLLLGAIIFGVVFAAVRMANRKRS